MLVKVFDDATSLLQAAAEHAAAAMQSAISERDCCRIVVATAASQFPFLEKLTASKGVHWNKDGENGHIEFNDPPADIETEEPNIIVKLDEARRGQQVGEGCFDSMAQVPARAISMSPRQILKSREIIAVVLDQRKAKAVKASLEEAVSEMVPASILRQHPNTTLNVDRNSASQLSQGGFRRFQKESLVTIGS